MLLRIVLFMLVFLFSLGIFFPKYEILDYSMHQYTKQYDVALNALNYKGGLSDSLHTSKLLYNGEEIANIRLMDFLSLFFYNEITMENIELEGIALGFIPPVIEHLNLKYHVFNPLNISIHGRGDFGTLEGHFDLLGSKLILRLSPSKIMMEKYNFVLSKGEQQDTSYLFEFTL